MLPEQSGPQSGACTTLWPRVVLATFLHALATLFTPDSRDSFGTFRAASEQGVVSARLAGHAQPISDERGRFRRARPWNGDSTEVQAVGSRLTSPPTSSCSGS